MDLASVGWILFVCAIVLTQLLALYCVYLFVSNLKPSHGKAIPCSRCLVVIAHPDDETMFFAPFIVAEIEQNSEIHLLCFSNGGFYGNGEKRAKELHKAAETLGIASSLVTLLDWPHFPDNPKVAWKPNDVREVILDYCSGKPQIDAIVTFDSYVVSGHLNHIAIYNGVRSLVDDSQFNQRVFILESVSVFRKYCRPIDEICSIIWPSPYRYRISDRQAARVQAAMQAHESQLMWFREVYRIFSRYMRINTFVELSGRFDRHRRRERPGSKASKPRVDRKSVSPPGKKTSGPPVRNENDIEVEPYQKGPKSPFKEVPSTSKEKREVGKSGPAGRKIPPIPSKEDGDMSMKKPMIPSLNIALLPPGKTAYNVPRSPKIPGKDSSFRTRKKLSDSSERTSPLNRRLPKAPPPSRGKFDRLSRSPPGKTACPISRPKFERDIGKDLSHDQVSSDRKDRL